MVLGIRGKSRKNVAVEVDYVIHVREIKPWSSSLALKSVQSVFLQWQNGGQASGSFFGNVGDGGIEFGESFRLPVVFYKEKSRKSSSSDSYQKNYLEFQLSEPRKDNAGKAHVLGSAVINLADYATVVESTSVGVPLNLKKSSKSSVQPVLYVNVQPCGSDGCNLSKQVSLDNTESHGSASVSGSLNEVDDEIDSFIDDDGDDHSSQSSRTVTSSAFEAPASSSTIADKKALKSTTDNTGRFYGEPTIHSIPAPENTVTNPVSNAFKHPSGSSSPLSSIGSSSPQKPAYDYISLPHRPRDSSAPTLKKSLTQSVQSSASSSGFQDEDQEYGNYNFKTNRIHKSLTSRGVRMKENAQESTKGKIVSNHASEGTTSSVSVQKDTNSISASYADLGSPREDDHLVNMKEYSFDRKLPSKLSQDATRKPVIIKSETLTVSNNVGREDKVKSTESKHVKSVEPSVSAENNSRVRKHELMKKSKEAEIQADGRVGGIISANCERETITSFSDSKNESTIEMLKDELREAAAVEVSLYSIVAEHGGNTNKIHAPARRLSRFYIHACNMRSPAKKANAARAAITGLILVSKACGNDVPRLTFWLSNSIVLRAIISQGLVKDQASNGKRTTINGGGHRSVDGHLSEKNRIRTRKDEKNSIIGNFDNWEDPHIFMVALEKFEAWIFSRIVESVWWQNITPHMQSAAAKGSTTKKGNGRKNGLGDQEQGNFSIELWKKAFKDACERLCPVRAGGHECGCLSLLAHLVMEQLVNRLDVAMFNAILRENGEEMPTDPVSDPISESKVLPIPAGKSSFGAGAQLKNVIGSWSRWLTDLFGMDDTDVPDNEDELSDHKGQESETSFKAFRLLNALSDLMMLPSEMLAEKSIREEVCPTFGASLIKRVLYNFVTDEFCPEPIPDAVFEVLDDEENLEAETESVTTFPFSANPTFYSPPPAAASLIGIVGEVGSPALRSGSSVLKKSYTSDDELDELDSPMTSIIENVQVSSKTSSAANPMLKWKGGREVVRYQLLRQVWKDSD
ncbi:uncharacterized protein LOC126792726 [Argentina anserina]|uniref:uncharacterized protein LOC126792726 n=1 Tax=Argentina anserina TaxID=57926 RepID=UPI002176735B|nr:uncharacterized protein LOC126792726 [Potentilla anserina]